MKKFTPSSLLRMLFALWLGAGSWGLASAWGAMIEFNNTGGTSATNGLHIYIEDTTHIQVRRGNNSGQVYQSTAVPPSANLDNGVFLRANGRVYGPDHNVATFAPDAMYNTYTITGPTPANPSSSGMQQTATQNLGITSGPQVSILWKYINPYDFMTAEVTLTIPSGYAVSAANPVRYYHIFDTFLGGSDNGCGVKFTDTAGHLVVGTYPPSGSTCPSSTSIPAGVSIVESFRERSGRTFSAYCSQGWASFWTTGSPNCYVKQTASLSNAISTTYIDTGIGVEFDFTATGTYTFSYDFVIGSPTVPPYDHLEIQHDGSGTLCPDTVTVLGCTSSTVPCPAGSYLNASFTGTLTASPTTPTVTFTPNPFSITAGNLQTSVSLQAAAPSGAYTDYTLGASGLSAIPLNGVKCWNTATNAASCAYRVNSTPCVADFECIETGVAYNNLTTTPAARNPLYTKLTGTNFKFDVVALQSGGAVASGYTAASNVTVELFDDSASPQPACSAYTSPVASQAITFVAGDAGRKTLPGNFNLAKAYRKLRCRVSDSNLAPVVRGCSSDDFTVRPQSFTIASSNANADNSGVDASASPIVKAGANFALAASAGVVGYDGTPLLDTTLDTTLGKSPHTTAMLEWGSAPSGGAAAPGTGTIAGVFAAAVASPASPATATDSVATGSAFTYDEVGYFRFKANGVYDATFPTDSGDIAKGDCTDDFSNTAVSGKYGCKFGNSAASGYFGRFVPDHFDTTVTEGCPAVFSYSGQPFTVTTTARNSSGATTLNYDADAPLNTNVYSKAVTLSARDSTGASANPGPGALSNPSVGALLFKSGVGKTASPPTMSSPLYTFTALKTAPTIVRLRALDTDGVTSASAGSEGVTQVRSGCVRLMNAYGSELLNLPVLFQTVYWNNGGWVVNRGDKCSGDATLASGTLNDVGIALAGAPASCVTCVLDNGSPGRSGQGCAAVAASPYIEGGVAGFGGDFNLTLQKPASAGTVTVTANVPTWLRGCAGGSNPTSRATFGIYKSPVIYRRETY